MEEQGQNSKLVVPAPKLNIKFKESPDPINIEIDLDALTWADSMRFSQIDEAVNAGKMTQEDAFKALSELLTKITGQDVSTMPARHVAEIIQMIGGISGAKEEELKN